METNKLGLIVLAIVSVLALTGLVIMRSGVSGMAGGPTYEQPAANKPLFLEQSVYLPNFNLCNQYKCSYADIGFYGESEPAFQVGIDELTGNLRCGCSDGREFQVRPDLIYEGTYR